MRCIKGLFARGGVPKTIETTIWTKLLLTPPWLLTTAAFLATERIDRLQWYGRKSPMSASWWR
jgi:hypothetical protein